MMSDPDHYDCDDYDSRYYDYDPSEEACDGLSKQYKARIEQISLAIEAGQTDEALRLSRLLECGNWEGLGADEEQEARDANPPPPKWEPKTPEERRVCEAMKEAWRGTVTSRPFKEAPALAACLLSVSEHVQEREPPSTKTVMQQINDNAAPRYQHVQEGD